MKKIVDKLAGVYSQILSEKGAVFLFALFLRDEAPDRWDLVLSGPWADASNKESFDYVATKLREALTNQELVRLSRIVIAPPDSPVVQSVAAPNEATAMSRSTSKTGKPYAESMRRLPGAAEFVDSDFAGMFIRHAFVFHAERPPAVSGAVPAGTT